MNWFASHSPRGWVSWAWAWCGGGIAVLLVSLYIHRRARLSGGNNNKPPVQLRVGPGNYPRKVSCSLRNLIVLQSGRQAAQYSLCDTTDLRLLARLVTNTDCYFIMEVCSDEQEEQVRALLATTDLYQQGLNPHKVLFCSTPMGRAHMVKQLAVDMHLDDNIDVLKELCRPKPWVDKLVYVDIFNSQDAITGVYSAPNLAELFDNSI